MSEFLDNLRTKAAEIYGKDGYLIERGGNWGSSIVPPNYQIPKLLKCSLLRNVPKNFSPSDDGLTYTAPGGDYYKAIPNPGYPLSINVGGETIPLSYIDKNLARYGYSERYGYQAVGRIRNGKFEQYDPQEYANRPQPEILGRNSADCYSLQEELEKRGLRATVTEIGQGKGGHYYRLEYEKDDAPRIAYEIVGQYAADAYGSESVVLKEAEALDPIDEQDTGYMYRLITGRKIWEEGE